MSKVRTNNIEPFSADQIRLLGKGIIPPKLTTAQRNVILAPEDGVTIYNTDTHAIEHYNSLTTAWESSDGVQSINGRTSKNQILTVGSAGNAPAVTPSGTDTNTINIPNARTANVTAGLISKDEYDSFNIRRFPVKNILYVVKNTIKGPQDYNSINDALDAITDASVSNPYKIEVGPGIFQEDTVIMKPYVWIEGSEQDQTAIIPVSSSNNIIEGAPNSGISKCLLTGATSAAAILFMSSIATDKESFFVEDCRFGNNDTHVISDSTNSQCAVFIEEGRFGGQYQFNTGFMARNGGRVVIRNSTTTSVQSPIPQDVFYAVGLNSEIVISGVQCRNGNAAAGNAVRIRDGARLRVLSLNIKGWAKGIFVENVGAAPYVQVFGVMNEENDLDLQVDHPGCDGTYAGSANHNKIIVNPSASLGVSITCNSVPSDNTGTVVVGSTLQGDRYDRLVNLSLLARKTSTLGVIEDEETPFIEVVSGLQIKVLSARGFLNDPTDIYLKEIFWPDTLLTLSPNTSNYIYVDTNSVVQSSGSFPGLETNILLGRVNTNASGVRFIENADMAMNHYGNKTEHFFRTVLGPVFDSGAIVTENASPRKLDITPGSYHYGVTQFNIAGGSAITFEAFYRDGSGGFISVPAQDTLSNTQYDDGSGTLVSIPAGQYARHHLYAIGDSNKYFIVFAQEAYAALADALTAPLPIIPSFMSDAVVRVAGIIVQEGVANILSPIIDIRPRIGFAAPSGTAVTDHGSLTGLNDIEDHPGYLTLSGARAMVGNLNMGGQNITNVNLVDGVDVSAHASRHLPNGADPLATAAPTTAIGGNTSNQEGTANTMARSDHQHDVATGAPSTQIPDQANAEGTSNNLARADHTHNVPTAAPVSIGTANAQGVASTFSKSDHVHNHGNQTNPSHHAVATTGSNGFMSSTDKTKLDGIETGATADQVASEVPFTPAGNIAASNVQDALNELDSEKQAISQKGQANGYAPLGADTKIPVQFLPDTVVGSVDYKGTWNASTNTPNLGASTPDKGDYYVVNVAGSTSLGGITDWQVGDWAIYNGTTWEKVDNTDQVTSVFGRQGTVTAQSGDYNAGQITNTPSGGIAATTVQAALNELDSEKADKTTTISAGAGLTGGGDLSANRTISMPNVGTAGTYGSASQVPVITTDAQGRITSVVNTAISIVSAAVTDFAATVRSTLLTGYTLGANTALLVTDTVLEAFGKIQAQLNNLIATKADKSITINPGYGLTGGGDLSANRTLSVSLSFSDVSATNTITTTSATDVLMTGMTITPAAGTYLVLFAASLSGANNDASITASIYAGGVFQTGSESQVIANVNASFGDPNTTLIPAKTFSVVTVNGSEAIEGRWRRSAGTATATYRHLKIIRIA